MSDMRWWLDLATFAGIATLAVPVWSLNVRKRKLQAAREAERSGVSDGEFRQRMREILAAGRRKAVEEWRPIDQRCLLGGYALVLGAALLRLFAVG